MLLSMGMALLGKFFIRCSMLDSMLDARWTLLRFSRLPKMNALMQLALGILSAVNYSVKDLLRPYAHMILKCHECYAVSSLLRNC